MEAIEVGRSTMFAHELRDMLTGRTEKCEDIGENALEGHIYFKDSVGKSHPIDFIEVDDSGNIILGEGE